MSRAAERWSALRLSQPRRGGRAEQVSQPAAGWILRAEGQDDDCDRNPDERTKQSPQECPKEHREQYDEGRNRECASMNTRLDIAANDELDDVQAGEQHQGRLPGRELSQREQGRKPGCDERSDKWNVIQ